MFCQGDEVEEYQPLCEVQSDKATIEITSRYKGTVAKVLHTPGDIIKVTHMVPLTYIFAGFSFGCFSNK